MKLRPEQEKMTPMRQAYTALQVVLASDFPPLHRAEINSLLTTLLSLARDTEECGASAKFAGRALIYVNACEAEDQQRADLARHALEIEAQVLAAVMLIRRGRLKPTGHDLEAVPSRSAAMAA